jgi:hypothetical protein
VPKAPKKRVSPLPSLHQLHIGGFKRFLRQASTRASLQDATEAGEGEQWGCGGLGFQVSGMLIAREPNVLGAAGLLRTRKESKFVMQVTASPGSAISIG